MRIVVRGAGAVVALVVMFVAFGCASSPPEPSPTPSPWATPLFESDDEALAAAEEAYAAYVETTDQVFAEGGVGLERLEKVSAGTQLEADTRGLREMATKGFRSVGETRFDQLQVQRHAFVGDDPALVAYLCQDISGVDVVDASGNSVVAPNRPNRIRYEVSFSSSPGVKEELLVSDRVPWGDTPC